MKDKKTKPEKKITKETTFSELLKDNPESAETLLNEGMHCIGCPAASMETIEQGALAHGINPDELVEKVNKKIENRK